MNTDSIQTPGFGTFFRQIRFQRGLVFGIIIVAALLAFEIFNYSTTDYALTDLLGDLNFLGVRWATILAIAFCGIDFAGIARLFTPEEGQDQPGEVWYLFGAWLLAATMNAMLTWWGVSLAVLNHQTVGTAVIERDLLLRVVPIFVAVLVWLIRVLIIGTFSVAGDRMFTQSSQFERPAPRVRPQPVAMPAVPAPVRSLGGRPSVHRPTQAIPTAMAGSHRSSPKISEPASEPQEAPSHTRSEPSIRPEPTYNRPEPTYHTLVSAAPRNQNNRSNSRSLR